MSQQRTEYGTADSKFRRMIPELEYLEQILDEDWELSRSVSFIQSWRKDGWDVLRGHWEAGNIEFVSTEGAALPDWRVEEMMRTKDAGQGATRVRYTDQGARLLAG